MIGLAFLTCRSVSPCQPKPRPERPCRPAWTFCSCTLRGSSTTLDSRGSSSAGTSTLVGRSGAMRRCSTMATCWQRAGEQRVCYRGAGTGGLADTSVASLPNGAAQPPMPSSGVPIPYTTRSGTWQISGSMGTSMTRAIPNTRPPTHRDFRTAPVAPGPTAREMPTAPAMPPSFSMSILLPAWRRTRPRSGRP